MDEQLIPINNANGKQFVNARELHAFLESKQRFADWIKARIEKYAFEQGEDFFIELRKTPDGGRPSQEYYISIDMAKELCMVENNDKGKQARRYFIHVERKAKEFFQSLTPAQQLLHNAQMLVEIERKQMEHETRIALLESKSEIDTDYIAITGFASLKAIPVDLAMAKVLGKKATAICKASGIIIGKTFHPAYGNINTYPSHVLEQVFTEYFA